MQISCQSAIKLRNRKSAGTITLPKALRVWFAAELNGLSTERVQRHLRLVSAIIVPKPAFTGGEAGAQSGARGAILPMPGRHRKELIGVRTWGLGRALLFGSRAAPQPQPLRGSGRSLSYQIEIPRSAVQYLSDLVPLSRIGREPRPKRSSAQYAGRSITPTEP